MDHQALWKVCDEANRKAWPGCGEPDVYPDLGETADGQEWVSAFVDHTWVESFLAHITKEMVRDTLGELAAQLAREGFPRPWFRPFRAAFEDTVSIRAQGWRLATITLTAPRYSGRMQLL